MNKPALLFLFIFTLLHGCALTPPEPSSPEGWRLQGRIAYWGEGIKESGNIDWQYCGSEQNTLELTGPLGIGGLQLSSQPGLATLRIGEVQYQASSIEELAESAGWPLPILALEYWVRGHAAPESPLKGQMDTRGRLSQLEQDGWHIQYHRYAENGSSKLPESIEALNGSQRIKLIIRNWLPASCL